MDHNPKFVGREKYFTYDEMYYSDTTVSKSLLAAIRPIQNAEWRVDGAMDEDGNVSDENKEVSDFVAKNLFERIE